MPFLSTLKAAQNGSASALSTLVESCDQYITMLAERQTPYRLRPVVHPSSLGQETRIRMVKSLATFRGDNETQLFAWLRRIMLRCLLDQLRKSKHRVSTEQLPGELAGAAEPPNIRIERTERAEALNRVIERLPDHYRLAIQLRHYNGCSFEEVGIAMNLSTEAARKVWVRAIDKLGIELRACQ